MTLYSHNGGIPAPLPPRIRAQGRWYTHPAQWTPELIAAAGYVAASGPPPPVGGIAAQWYDGEWHSAPEYDPATQHAPVWSGTAWAQPVAKTIEDLAAELAARKASMQAAAKQRYQQVADGGTSIEVAQGVHLPVATTTAPMVRVSEALATMTALSLNSMKVVTTGGAPVDLTPALDGEPGPIPRRHRGLRDSRMLPNPGNP